MCIGIPDPKSQSQSLALCHSVSALMSKSTKPHAPAQLECRRRKKYQSRWVPSKEKNTPRNPGPSSAPQTATEPHRVAVVKTCRSRWNKSIFLMPIKILSSAWQHPTQRLNSKETQRSPQPDSGAQSSEGCLRVWWNSPDCSGSDSGTAALRYSRFLIKTSQRKPNALEGTDWLLPRTD